jgi:hypothetical protein
MGTESDWRLAGQERYLKGVTLYWRKVSLASVSDHEHCEFCGAKFMAGDGGLHEGFTTENNYRWVCRPCFEDFRELFQWTIGNDT